MCCSGRAEPGEGSALFIVSSVGVLLRGGRAVHVAAENGDGVRRGKQPWRVAGIHGGASRIVRDGYRG